MFQFDDEWFDFAYEQFRSNTRHVTDFDLRQLPVYEAAVKAYGDPTITVGDGYHKDQQGLYHTGDGCLTAFWAVFRELEDKARPPAQDQSAARMLEQFLYGTRGRRQDV